MATSPKSDAKGSMDGRLTNPEEVQDDAPVNQKKPKKSGQRESDARKGFKQASGTPLPGEDVDASEDEDEEKDLAKNKARDEVQSDEDLDAEDEEDSDDDEIPEGHSKESWKAWKARVKAIEDREKAL